jgi:hypothetical protein
MVVARVRTQVMLCVICGGQTALGQIFSEYFGFPAHHSTYCSTLIIIHHHPGLVQ